MPAKQDIADLAGFTLEAVLELADGADERAPGAAVTAALCGHWSHPAPCRWPHHTAVDARTGARRTVRVVAVSTAADRDGVRSLIDGALAGGELADGPTGRSRWRLLRAGLVEPRPDELDLAGRLAESAR